MVRVCRLCQNWCCYHLQSNRLCDKLYPTTIDGGVLGQISQPKGIMNLVFHTRDFLFGEVAQFGRALHSKVKVSDSNSLLSHHSLYGK